MNPSVHPLQSNNIRFDSIWRGRMKKESRERSPENRRDVVVRLCLAHLVGRPSKFADRSDVELKRIVRLYFRPLKWELHCRSLGVLQLSRKVSNWGVHPEEILKK